MPKRPEAYFLLARFHERRSQWNDCYKYASLALSICDFDCQPLKSDIEYPGYFGLVFEKAVSSWWWGKNDECRELLLTLLNDYDLDDGHYQAVVNNLKLFNIDAEEVKKK
jgi:hypothetical protein